MKYLKKAFCFVICICLLFQQNLIVSADKETNRIDKESQKKFEYTCLENVTFPSIEEEQALIDSMASKEYTDFYYHEAVDFFCSTKIDLGWNRILCVGDSVTLGVQTGEEEPYPINYPEILGTLFRTDVENEGIGGSTIWGSGPFAMCKRIVDYEPADAVFIMGGTNDWFYGYKCKLGDLNTPITFIYDFNWLCENLKEYYPNAEIFFIIPMDPAEHMGMEPYDDFDIIRNVERNLAASHGFHVIDLPAKHILSALDPNVRESYFSDNCHPNTMGYEILGKIIAYETIRAMYDHQ